MTWEDVGKKILEVAPAASSLAAPFLGPAGPLLPIAVKAVASLFGVQDPEPQPDQVLDAIKGDPQAAMTMKLALMEFDKEQMKLEFADIAGARARQIEHEKATGKTDIHIYVLAWVVVAGFLFLTGYLISMAHEGKQLADRTGALFMLLGTLATSFGMVMTFFFGAARSNQARENMLLNAVPPWMGGNAGNGTKK